MIQLGARATIADYMLVRGMSKKDLDKVIVRQLADSFGDHLAEQEEFQNTIVKRENVDPFHYGHTVYESRMYLLTPEEAKEYEELKRFKHYLKDFVR